MEPHSNAVRFLTANAPFADVNAATIKTIASRCRPMSRQPGESLFLEGDPCRDLYILVTGRVKCYRASAEGREQILKIFERLIVEGGSRHERSEYGADEDDEETSDGRRVCHGRVGWGGGVGPGLVSARC